MAKEMIISDLNNQNTDLKNTNEKLNNEKNQLIQEINHLTDQLKMNEIQIIFSDELKKTEINTSEENLSEKIAETPLSENEMGMVF